MKILFVTGSDSAFFNSLLVCLQSFTERIAGHRLLVCDFGLMPAQARFLDDLGLLLARPPELASRGVFACKAAIGRYLHFNGRNVAEYDSVVWLDADLTLMNTGFADFAAVIGAMKSADTALAACREPYGRNIGQVIAQFPDATKIAPFARIIAQYGIDRDAPYFSSGLVFCRSAEILTRWMELAHATTDHPLFEQNMFNVTIHKHSVSILTLPCDEWQAQGHALDRVHLEPSRNAGRPAAFLNGKNVRLLHTTSPEAGHLLIGRCRMTVRNVELSGPFKLFLPEPLRMNQLQLLAVFVLAHYEQLLRLGICMPAANPAAGFEFVIL